MPIERDTVCTVRMKAHEWEFILTILGKKPYEEIANIIQQIVPQVMAGNHDDENVVPMPRQEQG